ncbi:hypothetical protein B7494_g8179 [Chlorociboria aeruginascens]|nr:hypothetical protein B7494_g8179 [Chlorociboria aeruginascens]
MDTLDSDDWKALKDIMEILKLFYDLTNRSEATKRRASRGVLSDYITSLNMLIKQVSFHHTALLVRSLIPSLSTPPTEQLVAYSRNCLDKLLEYFEKVKSTPAYYASVVTTPQMKSKNFQEKCKNAHTWNDVKLGVWAKEIKLSLQELWEEDYNWLPFIELEPQNDSKRVRSAPPSVFDQSLDITSISDDEEEDQLETWMKDRCFLLPTEESISRYWLRQASYRSTHRIADMGLDMAAIPAMSGECERVFSQGKLLITGQRHALRPDIIEATQCLGMWMIMDRKGAGKCNWETPEELSTN